MQFIGHKLTLWLSPAEDLKTTLIVTRLAVCLAYII